MTDIRTIAVDFDGVIHRYSKGWQNGAIYDDPMPGAFDGLRALMEHYAVFIHTSRNQIPVANWLFHHGFAISVSDTPLTFWNQRGVLLVTNRKLPASVYLDDRALRFTSWPQALRELLPKTEEDTSASDVDPDMFDMYQITSSSEVYLTCSRATCQAEIHETLDQAAAGDPLTLGALMDLAVDHEAEHDGHKPEHCETVDLPGIGPTRVHGHLDQQGAKYMGEIVRAAQRKALEELKAEARAALRGPLTTARDRWRQRLLDHERRLATADSRISTANRDLCQTAVDELDQLITELGTSDTTSKETH